MNTIIKRGLAAAAVAAIAVPVALIPSAASAGGREHTEVEASFRADGARFTIFADGGIHNARGSWEMRTNGGGFAKGRVLCVDGDQLSRNDGKAAEIVVLIKRSSDEEGPFAEGQRVRQFLWDSPGPDKHNLKTVGNNADCDPNGFNKSIFNNNNGGEAVRGDIDVDIED